MSNIEEDGQSREVFENCAVRGERGGFVRRGCGRVILNETGAGEAGGADALDGEQSVIERAEAIRKDDGDGQRKFVGEVAHEVVAFDRHEPAADALDDDGGMVRAETRKRVADEREVDRAALDHRRGVRRSGRAEPDGIDVVERERSAARGVEQLGVFAPAAAQRFETDRVDAFRAERADEE